MCSISATLLLVWQDLLIYRCSFIFWFIPLFLQNFDRSTTGQPSKCYLWSAAQPSRAVSVLWCFIVSLRLISTRLNCFIGILHKRQILLSNTCFAYSVVTWWPIWQTLMDCFSSAPLFGYIYISKHDNSSSMRSMIFKKLLVSNASLDP